MEKGCEGFGVGSGRWSGRGWGGRKKRGNRDELERNGRRIRDRFRVEGPRHHKRRVEL